MRFHMSASKRTNLFDFFLTILGRTAGRRLLRAPTILQEERASRRVSASVQSTIHLPPWASPRQKPDCRVAATSQPIGDTREVAHNQRSTPPPPVKHLYSVCGRIPHPHVTSRPEPEPCPRPARTCTCAVHRGCLAFPPPPPIRSSVLRPCSTPLPPPKPHGLRQCCMSRIAPL